MTERETASLASPARERTYVACMAVGWLGLGLALVKCYMFLHFTGKKKKNYTRPLPLVFVRRTRLGPGLDTVLCLWLTFLSIWSHDLERNIQRETSLVAPSEIPYDHPVSGPGWSQELNMVPSAARGGCINSTDSLTDVWTKQT